MKQIKYSIQFTLLFFAFILISCGSSSNFSISNEEAYKNGFRRIEANNKIQYYTFKHDKLGNKCDCYIIESQEDKLTLLSCVSSVVDLKSIPPITKTIYTNDIKNKFNERAKSYGYEIEFFEDKLYVVKMIEKPLRNISEDYLVLNFKELGLFMTSLDALLLEFSNDEK